MQCKTQEARWRCQSVVLTVNILPNQSLYKLQHNTLDPLSFATFWELHTVSQYNLVAMECTIVLTCIESFHRRPTFTFAWGWLFVHDTHKHCEFNSHPVNLSLQTSNKKRLPFTSDVYSFLNLFTPFMVPTLKRLIKFLAFFF